MEALGEEYPKQVYRDGGSDLIEGRPVQTSVAHDEEEERALRLDGWRLHPIANPLDHDGDNRAGGSLPRKRLSPKPAVEDKGDV